MSNHAKAGIAAGVLAIGMYLVIRFVLPLFTPFIVALFIAILIDPVVSFLSAGSACPAQLPSSSFWLLWESSSASWWRWA